MSIENYKPDLWESAILGNFHESSFVGLITTPPTDTKGKKVLFNRINKGAWKKHDKTKPIEWSQVSTTLKEMEFPHEKYYAFMVSDVDSIQAQDDVLRAVTKEQTGVIGEEIDQEVVTHIISKMSEENTMGSDSEKLPVTPESAYELLVDLNTMATMKKVPVSERYFIISPLYLALLEKDSRFTNKYEILENGLVDGANINGSKLIARADNPIDKVLLTHKSGTSYAMQLEGNPEGIRLQDFFSDGVRGLVKYGYEQLRDDCSFLAHVKYE